MGHTSAVDWWTLGILIYEMIVRTVTPLCLRLFSLVLLFDLAGSWHCAMFRFYSLACHPIFFVFLISFSNYPKFVFDRAGEVRLQSDLFVFAFMSFRTYRLRAGKREPAKCGIGGWIFCARTMFSVSPISLHSLVLPFHDSCRVLCPLWLAS